jgi:hypothetical protein
MGMNVVE